MNNYDFEQHVGQPAKGGNERIDIFSNVPSKSFILMLFHVPSDQDAKYFIAKIPTNDFQSQLKCVRIKMNSF